MCSDDVNCLLWQLILHAASARVCCQFGVIVAPVLRARLQYVLHSHLYPVSECHKTTVSEYYVKVIDIWPDFFTVILKCNWQLFFEPRCSVVTNICTCNTYHLTCVHVSLKQHLQFVHVNHREAYRLA